MKKNPEFTVQTENTLLPFLLERFSGKSRNYVKGILKRGQISVDGEVCRDFSRPLSPGTRVSANLDIVREEARLPFPVLFEDKELLVIDKPAGMLSVSTDKESRNTAYFLANEYMKQKTNPGRVFIVHRLDRETSGVMLLAKSEALKLSLQDNWDEAVCRRCYTAVIEGQPPSESGKISSWLKQTKTLLVYSSTRPGDGKLAITGYSCLKSRGGYSLMDLTLETGRKNQIRVHMKDIGTPVAGDKKYGAKTDPLGRLALHARVLSLNHPVTGKELHFESPVPQAFTRLF